MTLYYYYYLDYKHLEYNSENDQSVAVTNKGRFVVANGLELADTSHSAQ